MPTRRQVTNIIRQARTKVKTWQEVNDVLYGGHMSNVVLSRIANPSDPYWPVEKEYADLLQPPKIIFDTDIAKRTLVIHATLHELHIIQERYKKPRDRAIKLLLK